MPSITEGLIIAVIILLIVIVVKKPNMVYLNPGGVTKVVEAASVPILTTANSSPEHMAMQENMNSGDVENGNFHDYIVGLGVDSAVLKNHQEFASDILNTTKGNNTGRTLAMGEIESDDGVAWVGIRGRPQAIPASHMGNPTQVADFRKSGFSDGPKFTW